ncbi:hypothetical protein FOZ63_002954, partial [Perkinsus olseni]
SREPFTSFAIFAITDEEQIIGGTEELLIDDGDYDCDERAVEVIRIEMKSLVVTALLVTSVVIFVQDEGAKATDVKEFNPRIAQDHGADARMLSVVAATVKLGAMVVPAVEVVVVVVVVR